MVSYGPWASCSPPLSLVWETDSRGVGVVRARKVLWVGLEGRCQGLLSGQCCKGASPWRRKLEKPGEVGSPWIRNQTRGSCTGRQILNHWTTREVPYSFLDSWAALISPSLLSPNEENRPLALFFPKGSEARASPGRVGRRWAEVGCWGVCITDQHRHQLEMERLVFLLKPSFPLPGCGGPAVPSPTCPGPP